jgi:hypothetical protein
MDGNNSTFPKIFSLSLQGSPIMYQELIEVAVMVFSIIFANLMPQMNVPCNQ